MKRIGLGIWSVFCLGGMVWAAETTQVVANRAMPLTQEGGTARAMSLGAAVVGVPQGSASLFWNPAGLSGLTRKELALHHSSLGASIDETAVFGLPMNALGGFAASLNVVSNGTFEGRDIAGNPTGDYTAGDLGGRLGWGRQWLAGVSAGVAAKFNRQHIATQSYSAFAVDLGLLWNPFPRFNAGLTYNNLGTVVADRRLDSGWRIGASYGLKKDVLVAAATELKPGGFDRAQAGGEIFPHPIVALRLGYVYRATDAKLLQLSGLTAGFGFRPVTNIDVDYAYAPSGELGLSSHRLSLTYKFSHSGKELGT